MAETPYWTEQTRPFRAFAVREAAAGAFALGCWTDDGGGSRTAHGHDDANFTLVLSGAYDTAARGEDSRGALLIFNPAGTYHADGFRAGGAFFTVTVSPQAWSGIDTTRLPRSPTKLAAGHGLVRRMLRELGGWSRDSAPVAAGLGCELVGLAAGVMAERAAPRWLDAACDRLRDGESFDLTALGRAFDVHPVHLTRTFRSFLRCTPGEYHRAARLDRAAAMLTQSAQPLAEIALATGFSDQSHLNRHFRRTYGIAPGRYRALTRAA